MKVKYHPIRGLDDSIGVPSTFVDYIEDDQCEGSSKITGIYLHLSQNSHLGCIVKFLEPSTESLILEHRYRGYGQEIFSRVKDR